MKKVIKLTESDIHKMVNEVINRLKEGYLGSSIFSVYKIGNGPIFSSYCNKPQLVKSNLTHQEACEIVDANKDNFNFRYWIAPNNTYD